MFDAIFVGDCHITPTELGEAQRLLEFWRQIRATHPKAPFIFLGDQTDKNDSLSVRVMQYWRRAAETIGNVAYLVGNHDQVFAGSNDHAMDACRDVAFVADAGCRPWHGPLWLVGYRRDQADFELHMGSESGALVCHQDLAGATYDDGSTESRSTLCPSPRFRQTVSGHLHMPQEYGQIWFPGSPRWRYTRDAQVAERAVWWVEFADDGRIARRIAYPTAGVCRRSVVVSDSQDAPASLQDGVDSVVEVRGTAEYVARRRAELVAAGARVRGIVDRAAQPMVRESDGLEASMRTHLETYRPPNGTSRERLRELIQQRMGVAL